MPIRHIVLINWKSDVQQDEIDSWIKICNRIPKECSMVHSWYSGLCIDGPDRDKPSTHKFAIVFDLSSTDDWMRYLQHPYPALVYDAGMKVIDLERTASINMLLEAKLAAPSSTTDS